MTNTMTDRQRREFLQLAVGGALAASLAPSDSTPVAAEPLGQPVPFAADTVLKMAVELASKPFKAPEAPPLPSVFSGLTFEQYAAIRRVPGTPIWSDQKLGFSLEPLHRGFVYTTPIGINIVENGMAEKVIYDAANFNFGPLKPPAPLGDLGFSG
jgi:glucans biosynthesis protein